MSDIKTCKWTPDNDVIPSYCASCCNQWHTFKDSMKISFVKRRTGFTYCPYCGGKIKTEEVE